LATSSRIGALQPVIRLETIRSPPIQRLDGMHDHTLELALEKLDQDRDRLVVVRKPLDDERRRLLGEIARIDASLDADRGVPARDPADAMRIREQLARLEQRYEVVKAELREQICALEEKLTPIDKALAEVRARRLAVEKLLERNAELRLREELRRDQKLTDENAAYRFEQKRRAS
jgi:hypothetical protein